MRYAGFEDFLDQAKSMGKARVAVAAAADLEVLEAIKIAQEKGFVEAILVGDAGKIEELAKEIGFDLQGTEIIDEPNLEAAAHKAVDAVVDGKAHFLMKGLINTADFLRAVLRSERGLRTGKLLFHMAALQVPGFSRVMYVTDGGMNIAPTLEQKKEMLQGSIEYLHSIGMDMVKAVALAANEVPSPKMTASMEAKALAEMSQAGEFPGAIVEGPLALDGAVSETSLKHKGIKSEINGDTDLFLCPTIEVGNALGKAMVYFAGGKMAGIVLGAQVPIILTSRNDSAYSKVVSLAMAALNRKQ